MNRGIVVLVIIGLLVGGGYYLYRSFSNWDPNQQGQDALARITPGMTLQQVINIAGDRCAYRAISLVPTRVGRETVEELRVGTPVEFKPDNVKKRISDNQVPNGFVLAYKFSADTAFSVTFDAGGKVVGVEKDWTEGDLFKGKLPGQQND